MDDALILHSKTESDQLLWNIKAMFEKHVVYQEN
jgi:hypothetical protein